MGLTILFVPLLLIVASEVFLSLGLEPASIYVSVYELMDAELRCPVDTSNGLTTREGDFMWSYEANGIWQTVVMRKNSTLEQSFRAKLYDKDTKKWTLSNNKTVSEKFYNRVNISEDGKLILRNSTLNDSGNYKCSFKGLIDRGLPRESVVNLSVKPFQAERTTAESNAKSKPPSEDSTRELKQESRGLIVGFGIGIPNAFAVGIVVGVLSKRFYQRQKHRGGDAADVV